MRTEGRKLRGFESHRFLHVLDRLMPLYPPPARLPWGFIHMVKTGGAYVERVLREQFGWRYVAGGHDPAWYSHEANPLPPVKRFFGTIRDPWTWYCSLYRYAFLNKPNIENLRVWGEGSIAFKDVLHGWTHLSSASYPQTIGVVFQPVHPRPFEETLRQSQVGFWSFTAGYFYGNGYSIHEPEFEWMVRTLLDMHKLKADLEALMGEPITVEPDRNASAHIETPMGARPYRDWYDEEMLEWVEKADGALAARFGYTEKLL